MNYSAKFDVTLTPPNPYNDGYFTQLSDALTRELHLLANRLNLHADVTVTPPVGAVGVVPEDTGKQQ